MKASLFIGMSIMWAIVGAIVWLVISLGCGMGPDSPEVCNVEADHMATAFLAFLVIAYGLFALMFWSRRSQKGR